jgi:hypothetical protein
VSWQELFSLVASLATVLAALTVVVTAWIYYRQLNATHKNRELESIMLVLRYIDDLRLRRARYFVYQHTEQLREILGGDSSWNKREAIDQKIRELSKNEVELHDVDLWLNALNNICFLVKQQYIPADVVSGLMKNTLLHCWHAFHPYIQLRRRREDDIGEPSMYAKHFEDIVKTKCLTPESRKKLQPYLD